jgi:hypothetical protein
MRVLIDECLDWRLCRALREHQCTSTQEMGWGGLTNGMLLEKAQEQFDVFLTGDRNVRFQQNMTRFRIAVIVLEARSTRLADTMKLMPQVSGSLMTIKPGEVVRVNASKDVL